MGARTARSFSGMTASLRRGYVRELQDGDDGFTEFIPVNQEDCDDCEAAEKADCEAKLEDACTIEETIEACKSKSPFDTLAALLTTVKKYEYFSLIDNAYAGTGNKPFKLKATKDPTITDDQLEESANSFFQYLETYLEKNQVRTDEIPEAFNLNTLSEVTNALADSVQHDAEVRVRESINSNEIVMEKIFQRSGFMTKYIQAMKDTADYPIGVLWIDDVAMKKQRFIKNGTMELKRVIQCDVNRIDPCYFWATDDYGINDVGSAVFKLAQYTYGDIVRWQDVDVAGSQEIVNSIKTYLETHEDGYRMHEAALFSNGVVMNKGVYDVLVSRGMYSVGGIKALGVKVPDLYQDDTQVPCEVYYSSGSILRVRVMETADDRLGVYTTVFRRKNKSIFGWSLDDFLYPFATLYMGAVDALDVSVGKSIASIIQVDTGILNDPNKYLNKNEETGEVSLDLAGDTIVEFNSTNSFGSPNSKGVPIIVDKLPSDISQLIPLVSFIINQLEYVSGIPSILTSAGDISSALRTTSNFNAAFSASAKVIQSLLRDGESRMLSPSIRYIFDVKAASGDMKDFLLEAEPEILLSDTLARDNNDGKELLQGILSLGQFRDLVDRDKFGALLNSFGREVLNLEEDLVPDVGILKTATPSTSVQSV